MKIASVEVTQLRIPLESSYITSLELDGGGGRPDRPLGQVVVTLKTDDGRVGYGESAPDPAFPRGLDVGEVAAIIEGELVPLLVGRDSRPVETLVQALERFVPDAPLAIVPIDLALWDLEGKRRRRPVFSLFGGRAREFVPVHRSIGIKPVDEVIEDARNAVETGCLDFKLKVGGPDFDAELAAVAAVRELAGDPARIMVDANGAWSAEEAVHRVEALHEHRLVLVEQPVPGPDLAGMAHVRRATGVSIVADESCFSAADVAEIARIDAADVINVKLMKCGGLWNAHRLAVAAEAKGLECFLGGMGHETELATSAGFQFALSHELVRHPSGVMNVLTESPVSPPAWEMRGVEAHPRKGIAGLGVDPEPASLSRYRA